MICSKNWPEKNKDNNYLLALELVQQQVRVFVQGENSMLMLMYFFTTIISNIIIKNKYIFYTGKISTTNGTCADCSVILLSTSLASFCQYD